MKAWISIHNNLEVIALAYSASSLQLNIDHCYCKTLQHRVISAAWISRRFTGCISHEASTQRSMTLMMQGKTFVTNVIVDSVQYVSSLRNMNILSALMLAFPFPCLPLFSHSFFLYQMHSIYLYH